jgi:hypothetical protein
LALLYLAVFLCLPCWQQCFASDQTGGEEITAWLSKSKIVAIAMSHRKIEMAAGVTPGILEAMPIVSGFL